MAIDKALPVQWFKPLPCPTNKAPGCACEGCKAFRALEAQKPWKSIAEDLTKKTAEREDGKTTKVEVRYTRWVPQRSDDSDSD